MSVTTSTMSREDAAAAEASEATADRLDGEFYQQYYDDLADLSPESVREHWLMRGRQEGRFPNLDRVQADFAARGIFLPDGFSAAVYRFLNPDVAALDEPDWKATIHYLKSGVKEGRKYRLDALPPAQATFLAELYFDGAAPAVPADGRTYVSMQNMLTVNGIHSQAFLEHFDAELYILRNGHEGPRNRTQAIRHFAETGLKRLEPISFEYRFDPDFYRGLVPDAAELGPPDAYVRWINEGVQRGDPPNAAILLRALGLTDTSGFPASFDAKLYLTANPDLKESCRSPWAALRHLIEFGIPENRKGCDLSMETRGLFIAAADRLAKFSNLSAAKRIYERLLLIDPANAQALQHGGDCLLRLEDWFAAAAFYKARLAIARDNAWTYLNLATCNLRLEQWAEAAAVLAELRRTYPGDQAAARRYQEAVQQGYETLSGRAHWLAVHGFNDRARAQMAAAAGLLTAAPLQDYGTPRLARGPIRAVGIVADMVLPQCVFYRVEQKKEQLIAAGIKVRIFDHLKDLDSFTDALAELDAVIFYRVPAFPVVVRAIEAVRRAGLPSFYEIDDLMFDSGHFPESFESYGGQIGREMYAGLVTGTEVFRAAMSLCDYAIASTTPLLEAMVPHVVSGRGFVHRNAFSAVHEKLLHAQPRASGDGKVRIFYGTGTRAHNRDFTEDAAPALARILAKYSDTVELVIVGYLTMPDALTPHADQITLLDPIWDVTRYWKLLSEMDINLAVLKGGVIADCKSEIKWMEAAAAGVPSIVSSTATYEEVIENGVTGLIVASPAEWYQALETLVTDPVRRRRMGNAARAAVAERYSLAAMTDRLNAMFQDVTRPGLPAARRPKLLVVNVFFPPQALGGATRIAADNVRDLQRLYGDAFEIEVFTTIEGALEPYKLSVHDWCGVKVVGVSTPNLPDIDRRVADPQMEKAFAAHLDRSPPDLIHFHCIQRLTASVCGAARARGIPYLITAHDGWWVSEHQFLIDQSGTVRLYNFAAPKAEVREHGWDRLKRMRELQAHLSGAVNILAVSEPFAAIYRSCGFGNVLTVENGVTEMPALPRLPSADGTVRLGFFGGISLHKGYYLIRSVLSDGDFPNLSLTMIDDRVSGGPERFERWGKVPVRVRGKVPQDRIGELYRQIDVLLAPSVWPESYGLVAREALQAGCWVVASNRGAVGSDVTPGDGFVIGVETPDELARVLGEINADPALFRGPTQDRVPPRRVEEQARELGALYRRLLPA